MKTKSRNQEIMCFVTIRCGIEYLIYGLIIQENRKLLNKRGQKARKLSKRSSGSQSLWREQLLKGPGLSSCRNIKQERTLHRGTRELESSRNKRDRTSEHQPICQKSLVMRGRSGRSGGVMG